MAPRHHKLLRLSAPAVKNLSRPRWHAYGGGLFLEGDQSGGKRWAMRLTVEGRRRDFCLGPLHKVSLQQAREVAAEYRAKAYRGINPTIDKKISTGWRTFLSAIVSLHGVTMSQELSLTQSDQTVR